MPKSVWWLGAFSLYGGEVLGYGTDAKDTSDGTQVRRPNSDKNSDTDTTRCLAPRQRRGDEDDFLSKANNAEATTTTTTTTTASNIHS